MATRIIAIGALGGSGTRAVAEILIKSGVYMGDHLNYANDNLIFTRLFKNPEWFEIANENQIFKRLRIFKKYMSGQKLTKDEIREYVSASKSTNAFITKKTHYLQFIIWNLIKKEINRDMWGWKEPNTMIFLEFIAKYFPDLRYIHVIRNGLDMAFSNNLQQLKNWGYLFGIEWTQVLNNKSELPVHQLNYWIEANKKTIEIANNLLKDRFYILNHTTFCKKPETEVPRIIDFLGLKVSKQKMEELIKIPKLPSTFGRYRQHDLSVFSKEQLEKAKEIDKTL